MPAIPIAAFLPLIQLPLTQRVMSLFMGLNPLGTVKFRMVNRVMLELRMVDFGKVAVPGVLITVVTVSSARVTFVLPSLLLPVLGEGLLRAAGDGEGVFGDGVGDWGAVVGDGDSPAAVAGLGTGLLSVAVAGLGEGLLVSLEGDWVGSGLGDSAADGDGDSTTGDAGVSGGWLLGAGDTSGLGDDAGDGDGDDDDGGGCALGLSTDHFSTTLTDSLLK